MSSSNAEADIDMSKKGPEEIPKNQENNQLANSETKEDKSVSTPPANLGDDQEAPDKEGCVLGTEKHVAATRKDESPINNETDSQGVRKSSEANSENSESHQLEGKITPIAPENLEDDQAAPDKEDCDLGTKTHEAAIRKDESPTNNDTDSEGVRKSSEANTEGQLNTKGQLNELKSEQVIDGQGDDSYCAKLPVQGMQDMKDNNKNFEEVSKTADNSRPTAKKELRRPKKSDWDCNKNINEDKDTLFKQTDHIIDLQKEVTSCKQELEKKKVETDGLSSELTKEKKRNEEIENNIKEINGQCKTLTTTNESIRSELTEKEKLNEKLNQKCNQLSEENKKLSEDILNVRNKEKKIEAEIQSLKLELEKAKKESEHLAVAKSLIEQEKESTSKKYEDAIKTCGALEFNIQTLTYEIRKLNENLTKKTDIIERQNREITKGNEIICNLQEHLKMLQSSAKEQQQEILNQNKDFQELRNKLQSEMAKIIDAINYITETKQGLKDRKFEVTTENLLKLQEQKLLKPLIEKLDIIDKEIARWGGEIEKFSGTSKSKTYLNIEEQLQRLIRRIDAIQTSGLTEIKERRRIGIERIQALEEELERRVTK